MHIAPADHRTLQGGGDADFSAAVPSVSLAYQPVDVTSFTDVGSFAGANTTDLVGCSIELYRYRILMTARVSIALRVQLRPLVHTLSQPIEAQQIRLTSFSNSTGFLRVELYTDCLVYASFEGQAGNGVDAPSGLTNGLSLGLSAATGTALVENMSSGYEALVVRNTGDGIDGYAQLGLGSLALPSNVGR